MPAGKAHNWVEMIPQGQGSCERGPANVLDTFRGGRYLEGGTYMGTHWHPTLLAHLDRQVSSEA